MASHPLTTSAETHIVVLFGDLWRQLARLLRAAEVDAADEDEAEQRADDDRGQDEEQVAPPHGHTVLLSQRVVHVLRARAASLSHREKP